MRITKYFSVDSAKYYRRGSFRFGTLVEYRNGEQHRFTDADEGKHNRTDLLTTNRTIQHAIVDNIEFINCGGGTISRGTNYDINENVFCASIGPYSVSHHREMIIANPDLTHFAEIELESFLIAMNSAIKKKKGFKSHCAKVNIVAMEIDYGDRDTVATANLVNGVHKMDEIFAEKKDTDIPEALIKAVFTKPAAFQHEKEIRVVARLNASKLPPLDAQALSFRSVALRKSIRRMGRIKL